MYVKVIVYQVMAAQNFINGKYLEKYQVNLMQVDKQLRNVI